jgi:hypothetical protein
VIANSVKMYKTHLARWGFNKYHKTGDVRFVHQTRRSRTVAGKRGEHTIRSNVSNGGDLLDTQRRARGTTGEIFYSEEDPATPEHPEHWTSQSPPKHSLYRGPGYTSPCDGDEQVSEHDSSVIPSAVVLRRNLHRHHHRGNRRISFEKQAQKSLTQAYSIHHDRRQTQAREYVARNLVNPQGLWVPERLFSLIDLYIAVSVARGTRNSGQVKRYNNLETSIYDTNADLEFYQACQEVTGILGQGQIERAITPLKTAFTLFAELLRNQKPAIVYQLLEVLLYLIPRGKTEHLQAIRTYLRSFAIIALPRHHPLCQIYVLVSHVDAGILEDVLLTALKCNTDALERNLDPKSAAVLLGRSISQPTAQSLSSSPIKPASVVAQTLGDFLQRGAQ